MTPVSPPAANPCGSCPYRRDVPPGVWAPVEYEKLPAYDADTPFQPSALFLCHQQDGRACAGWVGVHDMDNSLALRFAALDPAFDIVSFLTYESPVPLWSSGHEAALHGLSGVASPGDGARRTIANLERKRARRDRGSVT